jgi:outer membrane receptor protein involved in Fe transport
LSSEKFFNAGWVDELKLKASIGQQGNDNIRSYAYVDTYSLTSASDTKMSASFRMIGNPDITWETTTNFNAGVEFSFFKSRLTGGLDFYNKKTSDLLFAFSTGICWLSLIQWQCRRLRNDGLELNLQGSLFDERHELVRNFNIAHSR